MDERTLVPRRLTPGLLSPAPSITGSASDHVSPELEEQDVRPNIRRKPIPRKGHTKSRRGCLNCKRRKVKCPETLPACLTCKRLGLACEYPTTTQNRVTPTPSSALQSTGAQFTMEDLQFFRHFLFHAYPPLPLKSDAVWQEVATLSHHYDFLIHAMLGLSASHLSLGSSADYKPQALSHRVLAIEGLNKALNQPASSKAEADALYATVMALAFQSSYMVDGMLEFISMIRGCVVVSGMSMQRFAESLFGKFSSETHAENVQALNHGYIAPTNYANFFDAALASVKALQPLCRSTLELTYIAIIGSVVEAAKSSSVNGMNPHRNAPRFLEISWAYGVFGDATPAEFNGFVDPENYTAQIILVHFFIIEYVVGLETLKSVMDSFPFRGSIVASWARGVEQKLPDEYQQYMVWPMAYVREVEAQTSGLQNFPKILELSLTLSDNRVEDV
ncbi:hypothetical protein B0T10DRAFT_401320 [Thelonectria olida]|uniref:Zn(2)-C6 fungal-type domain-containing protein n=1 Tax=Thelonectria olida TaxID=1576542 RepID=A0A9P9ANU6_9HYPO|nr:hypothetical protein B0T10DRAFT_401320 [Thelonectria olida]